jgi:hypothetical protein
MSEECQRCEKRLRQTTERLLIKKIPNNKVRTVRNSSICFPFSRFHTLLYSRELHKVANEKQIFVFKKIYFIKIQKPTTGRSRSSQINSAVIETITTLRDCLCQHLISGFLSGHLLMFANVIRVWHARKQK